MKRIFRQTAVLPLVILAAGAIHAQPNANYPNRPVRMIVPFAPGGSSDANARIIAPALTERWKQQIIIDPRPGAATVLGTDLAAKSPPDGHTLLFTTDIHAINAAFGVSLPYDSLKDFSFVSQLTTSPLMLVAQPSLGGGVIQSHVAARFRGAGGSSRVGGQMLQEALARQHLRALRRLVGDVGAFFKVDENALAVLLERLHLLVGVEHEALKDEGRFGPRPVKRVDIDAELQLSDRNLFFHC